MNNKKIVFKNCRLEYYRTDESGRRVGPQLLDLPLATGTQIIDKGNGEVFVKYQDTKQNFKYSDQLSVYEGTTQVSVDSIEYLVGKLREWRDNCQCGCDA